MKTLIIVTFISAAIHAEAFVEIFVNSSSPESVYNSSCWGESTAKLCATFDLGMKGLNHFKAETTELKILTIADGVYNFTSKEAGHFNNVTNIRIQGNSNSSVICSSGVGFSFIRSSNITINGLKFIHCGQLQNSTSVHETDSQFIQTTVVIYFLYCRNIKVTTISVLDSEGTALIFYNVVGQNTIESCIFKENKNTQSQCSGGGGINIEYSYCMPGHDANNCINNDYSESNVINKFTQNGNFLINNCQFLKNGYFSKHGSYSNAFFIPKKYKHYAFGSGGGLSVYLMGNSSYNNITIHNCSFSGNAAHWGGGLFIQFQDAANSNIFDVYDSNFTNNKALYGTTATTKDGTAGGGSRVAFFFHSKQHKGGHNNNITFLGCVFQQNKAYYGGGLSFYSSLWNDHNTVQLIECVFNENEAKIGFAADFTSTTTQWTSKSSRVTIVPRVYIKKCDFTQNTATNSFDNLTGLGAVNLNGVDIIIQDCANFQENKGSALSLINAVFKVSDNSMTRFHKNKGKNGGAIALFGSAFIHAGKNSTFQFTENIAEYVGGAIYHTSLGIYDFVYSHGCFIQYDNEGDITLSNRWNASFNFADNVADGSPNSIHASTLLPCLRDMSFGNPSQTKELFCEDNVWVYSYQNERKDCFTQITTAPSSIVVDDAPDTTVIPGKLPIHINYTLKSNTNHSVTSQNSLIVNIFNFTDNSTDIIFPGHRKDHFNYISNHELHLFGEEDATKQIFLETIDPIAVRTSFIIRFGKCPPGFIFNNKTLKCKCAGSYNNQVFCDLMNISASIARTSWIGPKQECNETHTSCELLVGFSPYVMKASLKESIDLPPTVAELNEVLCGKTNRKGTLCGDCKKGYGVSVNTKNYECVKCSEKDQQINWLYYILSEFLPVTIFFILVFLFSMKITHGPLNSFVFFCQIVTTVVRMDANGLTPMQATVKHYDVYQGIYMTPYDFWNLNFFRSSLMDFVLAKSSRHSVYTC